MGWVRLDYFSFFMLSACSREVREEEVSKRSSSLQSPIMESNISFFHIIGFSIFNT